MTYYYLSLLCVLSAITLNSQQVEGKFTIPDWNNHTIYLQSINGRNIQSIDSTTITNDGQFLFKQTKRETGLYQLYVAERNKLEFLSIPSEPQVSFRINSKQMLEDYQVLQSDQSHAWSQFTDYRQELSKKKKAINTRKKELPKKDKAGREKLEQEKDQLERAFSQEIQSLIDDYPSSLFTLYASAYQLPNYEKYKKKATAKKYPTEYEFLKDQFFSQIDFSDRRYINSAVFPDRIYKYLVRYTEFSEPGLQSSVDKIMMLAEGHDESKEAVLNNLLEHFHRRGPKLLLQFTIEEYLLSESCSDFDVDDQIRLMAESYKQLLVGNTAPDIAVPDRNGSSYNLSSIINKQERTVLFFWSSHCSYCEREIPKLKRLYESYKNKNLEIIAISLDNNKTDWLDAVDSQSLDWINLSDLNGYKSNVVSKYRVHKTPYFYLLDSDMKIIAKPNGTKQLESMLKSSL